MLSQKLQMQESTEVRLVVAGRCRGLLQGLGTNGSREDICVVVTTGGSLQVGEKIGNPWS